MRCEVDSFDDETGIASATVLGEGEGASVSVLCAQGHGSGDVIFAAMVRNGTGTDADYVEILRPTPSTDRYKVLQVTDTTGRLGLDWVRAH